MTPERLDPFAIRAIHVLSQISEGHDPHVQMGDSHINQLTRADRIKQMAVHWTEATGPAQSLLNSFR